MLWDNRRILGLLFLWGILRSSAIVRAKHSVRDRLIQPRFSAECFAPTICDLWPVTTNPFRIHDRDRPPSKLPDRPFNRSHTADRIAPLEKTDRAIAPQLPQSHESPIARTTATDPQIAPPPTTVNQIYLKREAIRAIAALELNQPITSILLCKPPSSDRTDANSLPRSMAADRQSPQRPEPRHPRR
jgi:hypothetical protein